MEICDRIFSTLDKKDKMAADLCKFLDIQSSTMSTWKTRKKDPPAKYMKKISIFLGVTLEWLLTGEELEQTLPIGNHELSEDENDLLALYRKLPERKKYETIGELKGFLKAVEESQKYLDQEKKVSV